MGEETAEVRKLLTDLRSANTDVATIGQYLQPRKNRLPVEKYVQPEVFDQYREYGESIGFRAVFSGPLVRSSYMAESVESDALEPVMNLKAMMLRLDWKAVMAALLSGLLLVLGFSSHFLGMACTGFPGSSAACLAWAPPETQFFFWGGFPELFSGAGHVTGFIP